MFIKNETKKRLSKLLLVALSAGVIAGFNTADATAQGSTNYVKADEQAEIPPSQEDDKPTDAPIVSPEPIAPASSAEPASSLALNVTSVNAQAGKKFTLKVKDYPTISEGRIRVTFESSNSSVATVSELGAVTLKKKGSAVITATISEGTEPVVLSCKVKVVAKFGKSDFGKYNSFNIVNKAKKWDYYWRGEWGKTSKYGYTYRRVRIGDSLKYVKAQYGDFSTKKCKKSKDAFLYDKLFNTSKKKLKVSKYADFNYKVGKNTFKLRFYFTKKNKVFGFVFVKNMEKITKSFLDRCSGYKSI